MEKFIEENARVAAVKRFQETIDWIYGEGQSAPTASYKQRLEEFKKIAYPIKARFNFRNDFPTFKQQLANFTQEINEKLSQQGGTGVCEEYCQQILTKLTEVNSFFNVLDQILASKQVHEDIGHTIEEVQVKFEDLKKHVNFLLTAPPPKKEEPPKPAEQQQQ